MTTRDEAAGKSPGKTQVTCPTCGFGPGVSCRAKPYNTRLSRPHAARRKAMAVKEVNETP
jgi:hypothetical protein